MEVVVLIGQLVVDLDTCLFIHDKCVCRYALKTNLDLVRHRLVRHERVQCTDQIASGFVKVQCGFNAMFDCTAAVR